MDRFQFPAWEVVGFDDSELFLTRLSVRFHGVEMTVGEPFHKYIQKAHTTLTAH
jgi:hypothetical protein